MAFAMPYRALARAFSHLPQHREAIVYARILIAIDGSQSAARALEQGLALARQLGSAVTIMHAADVAQRVEDEHVVVLTRTQSALAVLAEASYTATAELLGDARDAAKAAGVSATTSWVEHHNPAKAIVETADSIGADLIVMGGNGRRGFSRLMLGSQTTTVLQHAKVPVLVVRGEASVG